MTSSTDTSATATATTPEGDASASTSVQLGQIVAIAVDPDSNAGQEQAAAIITAIYDDGSLAMRVLGPTPSDDTVRNYVGEDGQPYNYAGDGRAVDTTTAAAPALDAGIENLIANLTPEQQAAVVAQLTASGTTASASTPAAPTQDGTPNTSAL